MHVNRLRRWLPDGNWTLDAGVAALAGFLAGQSLHVQWPVTEKVLALLFGG
jgi:hypothetical protein